MSTTIPKNETSYNISWGVTAKTSHSSATTTFSQSAGPCSCTVTSISCNPSKIQPNQATTVTISTIGGCTNKWYVQGTPSTLYDSGASYTPTTTGSVVFVSNDDNTKTATLEVANSCSYSAFTISKNLLEVPSSSLSSLPLKVGDNIRYSISGNSCTTRLRITESNNNIYYITTAFSSSFSIPESSESHTFIGVPIDNEDNVIYPLDGSNAPTGFTSQSVLPDVSWIPIYNLIFSGNGTISVVVTAKYDSETFSHTYNMSQGNTQNILDFLTVPNTVTSVTISHVVMSQFETSVSCIPDPSSLTSIEVLKNPEIIPSQIILCS